MEIRSVMKREVFSISSEATLEEAARAIIDNRVGILPVTDPEQGLIGILSLRDILDLIFPTFMEMLEDYDFVHDFGPLEEAHLEEDMKRSAITELMGPPTSVTQDTGLLRAEAVMRQHEIRDIPIVDENNQLVGIASWVDVGVAFLDSGSLSKNSE